MNLPLALKWASQSVSKRGLIRTGKIAGNAVLDLSFDIYWGTETTKWVWTEDLGANSEHDGNAVGYRPSKVGPLCKLIKKLMLPRDCVFIDLGSGKGRVLLLAAQLGFQKVIGVEFSPALCLIARQNVRIFKRQVSKMTSHIEVIESDATRFHIPPEPCIVYAYNPFDQVVMGQFVANLTSSLKYFPRPVWLIYNTPLHWGVIENSEFREFIKAQDYYEIGGTEFKVYQY